MATEENKIYGSKNRRELYENLSKDGFDLGTFEDFDRNMNDDNVRKSIHKAAINAGWDLPDFDQFDRDMAVRRMKIGGQSQEVDHATYDDFIKRHPSGSNRTPAAPQPKPKPQQAPASVAPITAPSPTTPVDEAPDDPVLGTPWGTQGSATGQSKAYKPFAPGQVRETGDPGTPNYGIPYRPYTQMSAAARDELYRQNDYTVKQVQKMHDDLVKEQARRNQPLVDTGSPEANNSVIKTQGQWEDELQQGANQISQSIVAPAVDKAITEFDKKADEIWGKYNEQSKYVDAASPMSIMIGRQANEAKDPEKILSFLQQQMEGLYKDSSFVEKVGQEADKMGIDRKEYIDKVIKPQIESDLAAKLTDTLVKRELPKSTTEYILNGLGNSIAGMLYNAITESKGQREIKNQAAAMTEEGQNPYYNPGTGAKLAQMGVSFAADAPFFGIYGRVSGQVAKQVAEREIQKLIGKGLSEGAARSVVGSALENSVGARMKNYIMQHVISGSLTMGGYNLTSEGARQMRDSEFDPMRLAGSTAEGLAIGTAFGITGGASQALSQPLRGFSKIGAKVAGFGAEAETMYATEELSKMVQGEEGFTNPFEGSVEALEKLGVMKLSGGHLLKSAGEKLIRAKEVGAKQAAGETLAELLGPARTGVKFTEDEQDYIRNSQEGKDLIESLANMHPDRAIAEVNGKKKFTKEGEQQRQQLAENYDRFMNNPDIPAGVKQKVSQMLGGIYRPGLETGATITQNEDGSVILKTRDKDGNCVRDMKFDNLEDAEQWRDQFKSQMSRNDAVNMFNNASPEVQQNIVNIVKDEISGKTVLDEMKSKAGSMKQNRLKRQLEKINQTAEQYEGREMTEEEARNYIQTVIKDGDDAVFNEMYDLIRENTHPADELDTKRNYWEGQQLSTIERHKAQVDVQLAEERLRLQGDAFADEVIAAADYPDEKMAELAMRASKGDITGDQLKAALDYYNKTSKVRGMMDEALKSVDNQVEAANAYVRRNTHTDSGSLIDGIYRGRNYYVTAGHFQISPDGRLIPTDNSGLVILRDKETGDIVTASPNDIQVNGIQDPNRIIEYNESMEGLRGQLLKEADDSIDLHPDTPTEAANGDIYKGADGNTYMAMQVQDEAGDPVWSKVLLDENGEPTGNPMPFDMEEYRKAKSDEMDAADIPTEEAVAIVEGQNEKLIQEAENAEIEQNYAQNAPENIRSGILDNTGGEAGAENGTGANNPPVAASSRIPVDEKGKQLFEQAKPGDTLAELIEKYGKDRASQMVDQMIVNASKKLEELAQKDMSGITDMNDIAANEDEISDIQRKLDYWNGVKQIIENEREDKTGQAVDIQNTSGEADRDSKVGQGEIQAQGTEAKAGADTQQQNAEGPEANTGVPPVSDTNVSGGAPEIDVKGRKQVKRGLEKLAENYEKGDLIGCLNEINTIMKNVKAGEKGAITPEEKAYVNRILKEAKKAGYEVIDLEGKEYNEGSKQTADFQNDPILPLGTRVISNVRKPLILKNGEIVQSADVVVKQNLGQNDIEALQVAKMYRQKDLEGLKRANQNDVIKTRISELESEIAKIDEDIKQLEKQSAQQKVAQAVVKNNVGKRYEFKNQDGTRSEFVIDNFKGDDMVTVTRQDFDANGNPKAEPYSQDLKYVDVGNSIVNGYLKPSLSTDEKLRQDYNYHNRKSGGVPIIDVLTDNEKQQLFDALRKGDTDKAGYLEGEFINQHREDIILRGREIRNEKVDKAMSRGSKAETLRAVRDQYKGFDEALSMLEDGTMEPQSIEEYVANALGDVPKPGNGLLAYESYEKGGNKIVGLKDESGFGKRGFAGDTKGFNPWLAPKGKGISLKQLAEQIHESLPEGMKEQFSDQDIRNIIQNIMTGAEKPTDIANYILKNRLEQAEAAARREEENMIDNAPAFQKVYNNNTFANRLQLANESVNQDPTEGQKKAGNYKKGHISFGGYDFTIENPAGSIRRGTDAGGKKWEQKMNNTYGYILGKRGKDGDHLDMFINDKADLDNWNGNVYVVDQIKPDGSFDEHKILYGFDSENEAREAYLSNYEKGWQGLGKITGVEKEIFDKWLDASDYKIKDFADYSIVKHKVEQQMRNFDTALKQLNTRGISIDNQELLDKYGLKNVVLSKTGDHLTLTHFIVDQQGQGNGTRFMEDLARLADEKGWTLALTPSGGFGAKSVKRLKDFYKRFGFADNKGRNADFYTRESMIRRPKETVGANTPERQEQALRDAVVEHLRSKGIEVSTDWKLGQKILDEYNDNGQVKKMGSRVESKKKQLSEELGDREMTDAQKTIANVFTGKSDNEVITISRDGKDFAVKMRQGNELGAGTKHSLYGHYNTGLGVISADDIMRIPNVLANGERKPKQRGNVKLAEYRLKDENGVRYTVVTEVKNSGEVFNDFYTNKKASNQTPQMPEGDTPESARTNDLNASGAKVQQNSESSKDSGRKFFKTADGHAYGYTMGGKIYVDPRIATSETPIHEYGHLYCAMKRQTDPEGWNDWKQVMFGDKLVQPIIDKVRRDYPELSKDGKEDDFAEEIITQFSGKRGSERLREIADEVAKEKGGVFGKAEAITAMQRLKSILNRFWEGIAKMMGWKYTNANQIADRIMADMLNGVDPTKMAKDAGRLRPQAEIERTLMGVHNLSEDKLRKVLKQGGLANPSLAVIDTKNHMHNDYGDISLIPKASMIDSKTGRNAGTFTADAWTPTYPTVYRRMKDKGQSKFWKDIRKLNDEAGEVANHMRMAFDTWLDKEVGQERLAYWYMSERGMKPELVLNKNPYGEDIVKRIDELTDNGNLEVSRLPEEQIKEIADMYHAYKESKGEPVTPAEERIAKLQERIDPNKQTPFSKLQQYRLEELQKYGELLHNLNDFEYAVRRSAAMDGKPNVEATVDKAAKAVKEQNLEQDFDKWLQDKADSYGIEEWLYNGTDDRTGRQKYVRNTLENASKLMRKEGLNGATNWSSAGNWIAKVANKEKTLGGIRKNRKNLDTTREEHDAFREKWGGLLYDIAIKMGQGDHWSGENRMGDALDHSNPADYVKREYGVDLSKEDRATIDEFIKQVRTNFPTGYFETKFERPVMLDEFEIAVVPENTSPDVVEALKNAGLDVRTYDNSGKMEERDEARRIATMDAVQGRDDIMFQMMGKKGAEEADKAEGGDERKRNLAIAEDSEKAGVDAKAIKLATGWERGADGQWRYEIPDADVDILAKFNDKFAEMKADGVESPEPILKLSELLGEDNELFKYYPKMKNMQVLFSKGLPDGTSGAYDNGTVELNIKEVNRFDGDDLNNENLYGTLLHEIQHAIQDIEGFAQGGNLYTSTTDEGIKAIIEKKNREAWWLKQKLDANRSILNNPDDLEAAAELEQKSVKEVKDRLLETINSQAAEYDTINLQIARLKHTKSPSKSDAMDLYHRLAGEVEARNVESRMALNDIGKRQTLASVTEDVPRDEQVIINGNGGQSASIDKSEADTHPDIRYQRVGSPESEITPEERQYWNQWDKAMKKWKEKNAIPEDQTEAPEKPRFQPGENALDYAKKLVQWNREKSLWQTAPKLEDYRQVRDDRDIVEAARQNEQRYPDSPSAKMRRVASDMMRIRHAMSRQKAYDKATVKAVTDFAQDFMKLGFGDNLSRGEMERMLSSVKNATGAKDIKKNVDNIMNILIDNHLRNLDQRVQKLSSTKELSKTAQGVEKQGRLELKGQRMIKAFRDAREKRMTLDQINERMAEVAEKMNRSDDEAPMWEQDYEGLSIARQYVENIEGSREEWADLDTLYKDAVKDYKTSGRSYKDQQEYLESLEQAMQENKIERIGYFGDIIGRLEGNIAESMQGAKEFVEREKQRVKHIQDIANYDLAGKDMGAMREKIKGKPANFFLQPLGTFEQMLKQFGSRNANGEGYLYDYFMRNWMDATDKAFINEQKAKEELDAKAREVFGGKVKRWSDLYDISRSLPTMDVEVLDGEEPKTFKLTQGNLLYIYMADKMVDGRMKLRKMGIDEDAVEKIKDFMDPRLVQLGDWLQGEYLPQKRTEYNKVHERMFGAPMAAIDNYFPLKVLGDARYQEQDVNVPDSETLPSTITGNIIKRRKNALPLDILHTDALSLAIEHVEDMERWAAQAEWNKDINTLLSYTTFRNKVKNMDTIYGSGDALWNSFKDAAKMAAGTYNPSAKSGHIDKTISNIAKGVTAAKINFRVYTAFKQLLSAPAFLHDVNLADFVHDAANPYGSWKWAMENMPVFQKRWKSRQVGDTRLMDDPTDWKMWKTNVVQMATRLGMSPNALVDGVTCAVGARSIYKSRYKKYKEIGASDEVAHKRALQDAEIGYNLTQQSSEGAFVSAIQKDRTVAANMLSVFRNSSMAYTRQWVDAARNLRKRMQNGYKEDSIKFMTRQMQDNFGLDEAQAKRAAELEYAREGRRDVARLLNMMFGVTVAWNLGASLPYLLIGDDDNTKKEMLTDALLKGLIAGPTEGFAAGNIFSDFMSQATNESVRKAFKEEGLWGGSKQAFSNMGEQDINPLPLFADIDRMIGKMKNDGLAAAQEVFNIGMQSAIGVNPQTFTDMWNAAMDYGAPGWDGTNYYIDDKNLTRPKELALFMMRLMNAPTSSWRNKYIDELGMNAKDAQKLPYEEMARRYAHYKHWKDAPIMGWFRGEEARNEKIGKIQKQFDEAVVERMERLTDQELMHNVARSGSAEEKRKYAKIIAQRLGVTPGNDSKKPKDDEWYYKAYQERMLYEDIREDEMLAEKYKNLENTFKEKREEAERKSVQDLKEFNEANKEWKDRIAESKKEAKKRMDWIRGGKYDTPSGKKGNSKKAELLVPGKKQLNLDPDNKENDAIMKNIRQWRKEALEILMRAENR